MKKYIGTFSINGTNTNGLDTIIDKQKNIYTDEIESSCKFIAKIRLKIRNSATLIKIEVI